MFELGPYRDQVRVADYVADTCQPCRVLYETNNKEIKRVGISPGKLMINHLLYLSMIYNKNFFQVNSDIEWAELGNGVSRQMLGHDGQMMMVKVKFEAGAVGAVHRHPHIQVSYIESGVFELTIGEETRILRQGDGYFVPPDVLHGCLCMEAGVLIDAFTPAREDFLAEQP